MFRAVACHWVLCSPLQKYRVLEHEIATDKTDERAAFWLNDVEGADFFRIKGLERCHIPLHDIKTSCIHSRGIKDTVLEKCNRTSYRTIFSKPDNHFGWNDRDFPLGQSGIFKFVQRGDTTFKRGSPCFCAGGFLDFPRKTVTGRLRQVNVVFMLALTCVFKAGPSGSADPP